MFADGFTASRFATDLIAWQRQAGRHQLPWQNTTDAYRIWLSEIMLQQTQVTAVIPYYARFLEHFPNLRALANAPVEEVMQQWSGLGYYSRARNLHACAQRVVADFGGQFPSESEVIASLPGIGRSTAAAIAAFAFGKRAAILDGNVKRVLCRVFAIAGFPGERQIEQRLWALAEQLLPPDAADMVAYTQGVMDLGATLCKPKSPACEQCPLRGDCKALAEGLIAQLPTPKVRAAVPERSTTMLVLRHEGAVFLEKRPPVGIWGGLWSFPEHAHDDGKGIAEADAVAAQAAATVSLHRFAASYGTVAAIEPAVPFVHGFTHFRLTVQPLIVTLSERSQILADASNQYVWMDLKQARGAALPAPVKRFIATLE